MKTIKRGAKVVLLVTVAVYGLLLYAMQANSQVVQPLNAPAIVQKPANPLEFRVCGDSTLRFKRFGDDLAVFCPGATDPVFTLKGCVEAKVTRAGTMYKVLCTRWIPHQVIPIKPTNVFDQFQQKPLLQSAQADTFFTGQPGRGR